MTIDKANDLGAVNFQRSFTSWHNPYTVELHCVWNKLFRARLEEVSPGMAEQAVFRDVYQAVGNMQPLRNTCPSEEQSELYVFVITIIIEHNNLCSF